VSPEDDREDLNAQTKMNLVPLTKEGSLPVGLDEKLYGVLGQLQPLMTPTPAQFCRNLSL
jgi:hypothetical protein